MNDTPHIAPEPVNHHLIRKGRRVDLWGVCTCGGWTWTGVDQPPTGRAPKLHKAYAAHVAWVTT